MKFPCLQQASFAPLTTGCDEPTRFCAKAETTCQTSKNVCFGVSATFSAIACDEMPWYGES